MSARVRESWRPVRPGANNSTSLVREAATACRSGVQAPGRGPPGGQAGVEPGYAATAPMLTRAGVASCRRRGVLQAVLRRPDERRTGEIERAPYRLRKWVERLINRCLQYRSLAARHNKSGEGYRALRVISFTILMVPGASF